jgi:hypothetical protein
MAAPRQVSIVMSKYLLLIVLSVLAISCKSKKVSPGSEDDEVTVPEFIQFFRPLPIPYDVTDTILRRKEPETAVIHYNLFARLLPDTLLPRYFGKNLKPHLYAVGKIKVPGAESYLFVKGVTSNRRILFVVVFDGKDHFSAARPVIYSDNEASLSGEAAMDAKYTLTVTQRRKGQDGQGYYTKNAYVFNNDGGFVLILTESNESRSKVPPIYDPIDTFPHRHKFSGDYAQDKRNIIAIRDDGKDAGRFWFFVHFEKDNGDCKGELKGQAKFVSPGIARYRSYSDPCTIQFTFENGGISMREVGGCGVHRDIKCFFEGFFDRRPEKKPKSAIKKT